jgi:hypothetical protein
MAKSKPLDLGEWVKSASARPVQCRICTSKVAREWFGLACSAMASAAIRVSDPQVAERMSADTGLVFTKHNVRTHREHAEEWLAVLEATK